MFDPVQSSRTWLRTAIGSLVLLLPAIVAGQPAPESPAEKPPATSPAATEGGDDAQIAQLIVQLGSDRFFDREQAQAALAKLGFEAFDALSLAQDHEDIEIAARAKYLVRMIKVDWTRDGDPAALKQAFDGYEQLDATGRGERINQLAAKNDAAWVAALCRLVRFERIPHLSKLAAVRLIEQENIPPDAWGARRESIAREIGRSSRPGAQWLRLYLDAQRDPDATLAKWDAVVQAEEETLARTPEESSDAILTALARYQIALLDRLGKSTEIDAAIARIVDAEAGETTSLIKLIDWLIARKSWSGVERLHGRFANRFDHEPQLAYALAAARRAQGDDAAAESLAEKAATLQPTEAVPHFRTALWLRERGWPDWSERELRRAIEIGPNDSNEVLLARDRLANSLHDRQADAEAAEVLEQAMAGIDQAVQGNVRIAEMREAVKQAKRLIASRMHYFRACHASQKQDRAQERVHLEEGLKADATDADILISLFRLPDQTDQQRAETKRLIEEAAKKFRQQIAETPDDANGYNQLAWLLCNTDREQQEALQASQRSLQLRPDEPGYLDTLGHCHYALKDFANAVKFQEQAVAGEPSSQQMRRQLEVFRKALAQQSGDAKS